jgi:hypothetical protein
MDNQCTHSPSKSDGKCNKCGKRVYGRCGGSGTGMVNTYEDQRIRVILDEVREKVLARPSEGRDLVEEPPHYMVIPEKDVEALDIIKAILDSGEPIAASDNAALGNSIKYLLRCKKKGNLRMDLRKAKRYIDIILGE